MAILALGVAAAACSKEAGQPQAVAATSSSAGQARGTNQEHLFAAIEQTYKSRKAKVRLEGSVVHVRMDGDASVTNAGWTDCRVISQLIDKGQTAMLEFPGGNIDCPALFKKVMR
ncbi:hypothetical protein C6568_07420 [Melaminivora suipulveris]|uniref:Uncharacterized protein n=1 Tax=Melaminivora suipulveris TaxID=2109913 RepID=A0A2R3QBF4_9BURK|nr:hypothetical protein [Melaminivora suipulveris]AVO49106.1 hypothetical protein C6568_07420 [Melaminivora suipulveris]